MLSYPKKEVKKLMLAENHTSHGKGQAKTNCFFIIPKFKKRWKKKKQHEA